MSKRYTQLAFLILIGTNLLTLQTSLAKDILQVEKKNPQKSTQTKPWKVLIPIAIIALGGFAAYSYFGRSGSTSQNQQQNNHTPSKPNNDTKPHDEGQSGLGGTWILPNTQPTTLPPIQSASPKGLEDFQDLTSQNSKNVSIPFNKNNNIQNLYDDYSNIRLNDNINSNVQSLNNNSKQREVPKENPSNLTSQNSYDVSIPFNNNNLNVPLQSSEDKRWQCSICQTYNHNSNERCKQCSLSRNSEDVVNYISQVMSNTNNNIQNLYKNNLINNEEPKPPYGQVIQGTTNQYAQGSTGSCTINALEAILLTLNGYKPTPELSDHIVHLCARYKDIEHTGIDYVFPKISRYNTHLEQILDMEVINILVKDFGKKLQLVKDKYTECGVLITKAPESICCIFLKDSILLYDSHPRPEKKIKQSHFILYRKFDNLIKYLTVLYPYIVFDDSGFDTLHAQQINTAEISILKLKDNVNVSNFLSEQSLQKAREELNKLN